VKDRGIIKGYKKLPNYNDERTAVYKHKLDKIIHVGIRGTALTSFNDLMNDMDLVIKNIPFPNLRTKEDDYINNRLDKDLNTYKRLRKQYPDHKIIFNGHSLGAVVVKHILDNTDDKNIEGHLFNSWLFNDYTKDINKDKRAVINDSDDLLLTPLKTLLKSIGILGTVGGVGAKIRNMFYESKKEQILNSPEYSLFQAQSIYNKILNKFPGLPPLLMREQETIFTNNFGNSRDQLERYLMSNSPETPLYRYYGTESFLDNLEKYDRQINNFNKGLINIKKYGKNIISGMLVTQALYLANIIYKYHASTNFKPKNKKLLIKKNKNKS
tara:strand:- start:475 stop:1452 length:978 start_codon:yes stop_codon:yes gene_type:complete